MLSIPHSGYLFIAPCQPNNIHALHYPILATLFVLHCLVCLTFGFWFALPSGFGLPYLRVLVCLIIWSTCFWSTCFWFSWSCSSSSPALRVFGLVLLYSGFPFGAVMMTGCFLIAWWFGFLEAGLGSLIDLGSMIFWCGMESLVLYWLTGLVSLDSLVGCPGGMWIPLNLTAGLYGFQLTGLGGQLVWVAAYMVCSLRSLDYRIKWYRMVGDVVDYISI